MKVREFLSNFLFSKLVNKFQQIAFVLFLGTALNKIPPLISFIGILLFLLTYFSTYFYNDLMDLEDDRNTKGYISKVLLTGVASQKEFIAIGFNLALIGGVLSTIWEPLLGILGFLSVIINNLRTHVRRSEIRQILLVIVELLVFEAFWYAFYGTLIPGILLPVFVVYSSLYAGLHSIYKDLLKGNRDVKSSLKRPVVLILLAIALISAILSLPALTNMPFHFFVLAMGGLGYVSFIYFIGLSKAKNFYLSKIRGKKIFAKLENAVVWLTRGFMRITNLRFSIAQVNNYSLFLLGLWLLASTIALNLIPSSYLKRVSFAFRVPKGIYEIVKGIDYTQTALLSSPVVREVKGLKDTIETTKVIKKRS